MKRIRLKKRPFFFEDLSFSHWLMQDRLLAIVLDPRNRVEEVRMDVLHYSPIVKDLKARHYL